MLLRELEHSFHRLLSLARHGLFRRELFFHDVAHLGF